MRVATNYDEWKTHVPDDDPQGEGLEARELAERCPDCGVGPDQECEKDCGCVCCRRREALLAARERD